ncbi:hypothetical protein TI04_09230, partial [Achromatium sp. WMS2]
MINLWITLITIVLAGNSVTAAPSLTVVGGSVAPRDPSGYFTIQSVKFVGSTVFSQDQLQAVAQPFFNRQLEAADIEELRYRLTKLYVDNGYINSGALFLGYDNHIKQLQFKLIEGKLEQINVTNTPHLPSNYIAKRVQ